MRACLLLAVLLVATGLAACGGGDGDAGEDTGAAADTGSIPVVETPETEPAETQVAAAFQIKVPASAPIGPTSPPRAIRQLQTALGMLGYKVGEPDGIYGENSGSTFVLEEGVTLSAAALQGDGKLVVAGEIDADGDQRGGFLLGRLDADGQHDPTFDDNGVVRHEFDRAANANDIPLGLALSGGKPVAVGYAQDENDEAAFAILRVENSHLFADNFEPGDTLKLLIDCRPVPLFRILDRNGYAYSEAPGTDSAYVITISRKPAAPASR